MIIDAHQHFWQLDRGDYGWLTPALAPLYRDFAPEDLAPLLDQHGIGGTILVQAAPSLAETEFLLNIAAKTPFVLGVVGWVDFESPKAAADIARLAANPKLVGLRPMIQDIADDGWMLRDALTPAFEAMITHDLTFDALVLPRHLPHLRSLLARHSKLRTVIDHAAKPEIAAGHFTNWASDMALLARDSRAYCKLSGLLTEAGDAWTTASLQPYIAHMFEHFGGDRLIWGSDWPVLTLAAPYEDWFNLAQSFTRNHGAEGKVFGQNTLAAYGLSPVKD